MPSPSFRSMLRVALIATCLAAAGCGDDGPSDEDQIATAVKLAATSEKVKESCEKAITSRLLREVYGTLADCRKENKPDPDDDTDDRASNSGTRIEDDKATTALKVTIDGAEVADGRVALVRQGDDWKLDRFGLDWLRSLFVGFPKIEGVPKGSAACFESATRGLSTSAVRKTGNAMIGGRIDDLPPAVAACLQDKTIGREALESGIKQGLKEEGNFTQARFECIQRRLRTAITDEQIANLTGSKLPPALDRKMRRAILNC